MLELIHIQSRKITAPYVDVLFTVTLSVFQCHAVVYQHTIYLFSHSTQHILLSCMVKCLLNSQPYDIATENAHRHLSLL